MHKTKLVLLTAAALLAITSGAEAAKVKRSSGFSMGRPASVTPVQKPAPVTNPVPGRPAASTQAAPQTARHSLRIDSRKFERKNEQANEFCPLFKYMTKI